MINYFLNRGLWVESIYNFFYYVKILHNKDWAAGTLPIWAPPKTFDLTNSDGTMGQKLISKKKTKEK